MAFTVNERTSPDYYAKLVDATGAVVAASVLQTLTLSLKDVATGTVLNGRNAQNVKNANDVAIYDTLQSVTLSDGTVVSYNLWWAMREEDTAIVGTRELERHRALFAGTWTDTGGKPRELKHEVVVLVRNLSQVPGPVVILLSALPTSDPHVVNALWNNGGTPTVSAG